MKLASRSARTTRADRDHSRHAPPAPATAWPGRRMPGECAMRLPSPNLPCADSYVDRAAELVPGTALSHPSGKQARRIGRNSAVITSGEGTHYGKAPGLGSRGGARVRRARLGCRRCAGTSRRCGAGRITRGRQRRQTTATTTAAGRKTSIARGSSGRATARSSWGSRTSSPPTSSRSSRPTLPTLEAAKDKIDKLEATLSQTIKDNTADLATVAQQVDRLEAARADLYKTRTLMLYRMRGVLSADQRAKLQAIVGSRPAEEQRPGASVAERILLLHLSRNTLWRLFVSKTASFWLGMGVGGSNRRPCRGATGPQRRCRIPPTCAS